MELTAESTVWFDSTSTVSWGSTLALTRVGTGAALTVADIGICTKQRNTTQHCRIFLRVAGECVRRQRDGTRTGVTGRTTESKFALDA
jgi:hypothetical protein